jgi:hypothetical protein
MIVLGILSSLAHLNVIPVRPPSTIHLPLHRASNAHHHLPIPHVSIVTLLADKMAP